MGSKWLTIVPLIFSSLSRTTRPATSAGDPGSIAETETGRVLDVKRMPRLSVRPERRINT